VKVEISMQGSARIALATLAMIGIIGCSTRTVGHAELHFMISNPPRQIVVTNGLGIERAWQTALRVQQIDTALKTHPTPNAAELKLLDEIRDESLSELEQGQYMAAHTSGGGSNPHFDHSNHWLDEMSKIIARGPAVRSDVRTEIMVFGTPQATLHFSTYESYKSGNPEWRSYDYGMVLGIRAYRFRVTSGTNTYDETVAVWDDPTIATIHPLWRP
jgi:hypothetical protein